MPEPLRFGIVGCGVIAPTHAEAIRYNPDHVVLAACCDIVPERAVAFAANNGGIPSFGSLKEMLKADVVDAVCVCTPSGAHADIAVAAARHGIHSLVEKPLDVTFRNMDRIVRARDENHVKVAGVFQRRTWHIIKLVKDAIDSGALGRIVLLEGRMRWKRTAEYYNSAEWRGTWALDGGGALMNQAIHVLDMLVYLGGRVEKASAMTATLTHDIEVEDTLTANLRYADGKLGSLIATTSAPSDEPITLDVQGDKGCIHLEDHRITRWETDDLEPPEGWDVPESDRSAPQHLFGWGHRHLVRDLAEAIRDDRPPLVPPEEGRRTVDVALAIYESARKGRDVAVKT